MNKKIAFTSGGIALLAALVFYPEMAPAADAPPAAAPVVSAARYKIALCDWMILKRQKLGAFQLTKDIGADGVEVDMGSLGTNETFVSAITTNAVLRQQFLDKARELNLEIPSLAMSGFYAQSFADRPTVPRMVQDCIDTMVAMKVKIAFLPLGVRGDLVKHPELRPAIVARLKAIAPAAEKAGVILGLETSLPAAEEIQLLDEIGSPAVKCYFNFSNALGAGRNVPEELRRIGKDRLCQIHATDEDGVWLSLIGGNGTMWVTLRRDEAEQMIAGLQMVLKKNVN